MTYDFRRRAHRLLAMFLLGCTACDAPPEADAPDAQHAAGHGAEAQSEVVAARTQALSVGCVPVTIGGRDYLSCTNERTWTEAQTDCRGQGMELARVDSATEDALLRSHMFAESWLGGTDAAVEGQWRWPDGARCG